MSGTRLLQPEVKLPKIVKVPICSFQRAVTGGVIKKVQRRAKLVLLELSNGWTIVIHLKMSGQLIWRPNHGRLTVGGHPIPGGLSHLPNKYSHVIFPTNRGTLFFNDQRQFGYVKLQPTKTLGKWLEEQGYGPEPLTDDFTPAVWKSILRQHRVKRVKPTMMDQTVIAGVGNIYADEACFFAKIKPARRIKTLSLEERHNLYLGLRHVMNLSIKHRGTTADAYRTATGQPGKMQQYLRVYGRVNQSCLRRDGGIIKKIVLAGRGTHYCPRCQR
jgi:formamidopyrimidine-DNA glycosylase